MTNIDIYAILEKIYVNLKPEKMKDLVKACVVALLILFLLCFLGYYFTGQKISEKQIWGAVALISIGAIAFLSSLRIKMKNGGELGFITEASIAALLIMLMYLIFSSSLSNPNVPKKQILFTIIFASFGVIHELLLIWNIKRLKKRT